MTADDLKQIRQTLITEANARISLIDQLIAQLEPPKAETATKKPEKAK